MNNQTWSDFKTSSYKSPEFLMHTNITNYFSLKAARTVQRSYRTFAARCVRDLAKRRRNNATFLRLVVRVQAFFRMTARRTDFCTFKSAVIKVQSMYRRRRLRDVYVRMRKAIIKVEARVRAWLVSRQEGWNRAMMARSLRRDIVLLWEREYTPLAYRSKFFLMIDGESYLHLALYEEEKKRLVDSLGGKYVHTMLITGRPKPIRVPIGQVNPLANKSFSSGTNHKGDGSPSRNPLIVSNGTTPPTAGKSQGGYNNGNLRLDSMERVTIIGVPTRLNPQVEARLSISSSMLKDERKDIYLKLKSNTGEDIRDSLFNMFEFDKNMKKRKQTLSALVWTAREEAHLINSAQVVLALSASSTGNVKGMGTGTGTSLTGVSIGESSYSLCNQITLRLRFQLRLRVHSADYIPPHPFFSLFNPLDPSAPPPALPFFPASFSFSSCPYLFLFLCHLFFSVSNSLIMLIVSSVFSSYFHDNYQRVETANG